MTCLVKSVWVRAVLTARVRSQGKPRRLSHHFTCLAFNAAQTTFILFRVIWAFIQMTSVHRGDETVVTFLLTHLIKYKVQPN